MLLVPLVAPLPSLAASVCTKSGSKRIFAAADVNAFPSIYDLFDQSLQIWCSPQSRRVAVKLDDEVMRRGVAVCEVGQIVEKGCGVYDGGGGGGGGGDEEEDEAGECEVGEEDSGAEQEEQHRGEGSEGAAGGDEGEDEVRLCGDQQEIREERSWDKWKRKWKSRCNGAAEDEQDGEGNEDADGSVESACADYKQA
ncbi:uncharacterized protein MONOS_9152 [Monocercomonoides exilis]|uniref:uncharacterized protein n=1 Tax=Monocercomonoides exilis TaxID=2049356 RepID=UPI00355A1FA4|nr:hypothetical protein MONOS_9152 [Monocercomonoides exilis]|eukprot:MONOS_9152.1-p1 / transcript=MONOS_9152.1 / gene=MONOS_9152 / organism=Monocercomonoides_exilis_PA203 / gene_product=unspecified product / transcript_product=unspecified product / location=Mono_scaffold00369:11458-12227(-) / protein_length=196 / sequence_SO=supercontig / SO=protein_coding / is_pseudo=false